MPDVVIPWSPQPKQRHAFMAAGVATCLDGLPPGKPIARAIGYGGAAGGGKSDALIGLAFTWAIAYPGSSIAFFRRTFPELEGPDGAILRMRAILAPMVEAGFAKWNGQNRRWTFFNGSIIQFCHCNEEGDVFSYQSQAFDLLLIDEVTHFTYKMVDYLMTRNRATHDGVTALAVFATNPGNIGHAWFKQTFKDLPANQVCEATLPNGKTETHYFIPALLSDNTILDRRDDGAYRKNLEARDPDTRRALLEADWDAFTGQAFSSWRRNQHVIPPFDIPEHYSMWRAVDWGYAAPWSCLTFAKDPDTGRVLVVQELYQTGLTDRQQARLIKDNTPTDWKINITYADPSMWTRKANEDRVFSTADEYRAEGVPLTKADNHRLTGKRKVDTLLANLPDGKPGLQIFETCPNLIRTLPALPRDPHRIEDVDSDAEDHAYDALRYGLTQVNVRSLQRVISFRIVKDPIFDKLIGRGGVFAGRDF